MDFGLAGKTAVVTGGSRGIGKAIARELAREGVDLVVAARSEASLSEAAQEIAAETGRSVTPMTFDATDTASVNTLMEKAADALGGIGILINSASAPGGSKSAVGPLETVDDAALLSDFDSKYVGTLRACRAAVPHMKKAGWGRIINISGNNARTPGNLSGGARNVALVHLTRTLAFEFGRDRITVNCIHPGPTRTERTAGLLAERAATLGLTPEEVERQDYLPGAARSNAIGRMVDASELAFVAVFLASDKARVVTGELISPSGGQGNWVSY